MIQPIMAMAGPVIYPLLLCSVFVFGLILERFITLIIYPKLNARKNLQRFKESCLPEPQQKKGLVAGLNLLWSQRFKPKAFRDELLSVFMLSQRQHLFAHLRWLSLLAAVAPLLGLLGTVLGIITMFQAVAEQTAPVTPALIASGMREAMGTTAVGLAVAIPALSAGQAFSIWSEQRLTIIAQVLNECSLELDQNTHRTAAAYQFAPGVITTPMEEKIA